MERANIAIALPDDAERARAVIARGRRIAGTLVARRPFDVVIASEGAAPVRIP